MNLDNCKEPQRIQTFLDDFRKAQMTRVEAYSLLHEGFRGFLKSGDEGPFVRAMSDATQVFKKCSQEVIRIEKELRSMPEGVDLANLLRAVQDGERMKLQATMALQSLRRVYEVDRFSWQNEASSDPFRGNGNHGNQSEHSHGSGVAEATAGISILNLRGQSGEMNRVDGGGEGEPSRSDYEGAIGEATHMLNSAVNDINEALEEIRYAEYELEDS